MEKYEGFKVSKKVEQQAKQIEKEITATEIMEYMDQLEYHNKSLGNFMVNRVNFDWNLNPVNVAIYNLLKNTMIQTNDGYWVSK